MVTRYLLLIIVFMLSLSRISFSSHIRGGEITYERIDSESYTFKFTLNAYSDALSPVALGYGTINFGDGSHEVILNEIKNSSTVESVEDENDNILKHQVVFTYTYHAEGEYIISFREMNRNSNILNMASSVSTPFYIESLVVASNSLKEYRTFNFLQGSYCKGYIGERLEYNSIAINPSHNQDSLGYELVVPKSDREKEVDHYIYPNNPMFNGKNHTNNGPAILKLNKLTGQLSLDTPGTVGEYTLAIKISQWRKIDGEYQLIGYVVRDMQILIFDKANSLFYLTIQEVDCVEVGELFTFNLDIPHTAEGKYKIEVFSELLQSEDKILNISGLPIDFVASPIQVQFSWNIHESHRRTLPYFIFIKVINELDNEVVPLIYSLMLRTECYELPAIVTSAEELLKRTDYKINIYPNPSIDGVFTFSLEEPDNRYKEYCISDITGRIIKRGNVPDTGNFTIDLSGKKKGVYIYNFRGNGFITSGRLISK